MNRLSLALVFVVLGSVIVLDNYSRKELESRSPHWPTVRANHLKIESNCVACGGDKDLNVHHIKPFHLYPDKELDPKNLITLCSKHHLLIGHLDNYKLWNEHVREDALLYKKRLDEAKEKANAK